MENNPAPETPKEDTGKEYFFWFTDPEHPHRTRWLYILSLFLYFLASVVAPAAIIGCEYNVFGERSGVSGGTMFIIACVLWLALKLFKKKVALMMEAKRGVRLAKELILFFLSGGAWAILAVLCAVERSSMETFLSTLMWVSVCEMVASLIDKTLCHEFEHYYMTLDKSIEWDAQTFLSAHRKRK